MHAARSLLGGSGQRALTPAAKRLVFKWATGALCPPLDDLTAVGPEAHLCPYGCQAPLTAAHMMSCPRGVPERALPDEASNSLFAEWALEPALRPREWSSETEYYINGALQPSVPSAAFVPGEVYTDGSCVHPNAPCIAKAACAAAQMQAGDLHVLVRTLPSCAPQHASMAEHWGIGLAAGAGAEVTPVADCASTLTAYALWQIPNRGGKQRDDVWRAMSMSLAGIRKTRAHRSAAEAERDGDTHDFVMNATVDEYAKARAWRMARADLTAQAWAHRDSQRRDLVRRLAAGAEACGEALRAMEKEWRERPRAAAGGRPPQRAHRTHWVGHLRRYRCEVCRRTSTRPAGPGGACALAVPALEAGAAKARALLHQPWVAAVGAGAEGHLLFCLKCGLYTDGCSRGMQRPCKRPVKPHWALRRILAGTHPVRPTRAWGHGPIHISRAAAEAAVQTVPPWAGVG